MSCAYTSASPRPLPTDRFLHLHPDGRGLVRQWFERALAEQQDQQGSPFEAFIFLWFSFNGFAACVTGIDRDAEIIRKAGNCPSFRAQFDDLRSGDPGFASVTNSFAASWPIFKVQDLRRLHLLYSDHLSRREQIAHYLSVPGAAHEPGCFAYHVSRGEAVPTDWPHTLQAIYRVRCNLFHGEKSATADNDRMIVKQAFDVLALFMERAKVLGE